MPFWGAETEELRVCADRFGTGAGALEDVLERIRTAVLSAQWVGPDADEFRQGSFPVVAQALQDASQRISGLSEDLGVEVEQQDQASAPDGAAVLTAGGPLPSPTPGPPPVPPTEAETSRDPDGRDGRRVERDERGRDREGNGHLSHDWAGRAILDRYLSGGGDWTLDHDPTWSQYMKDNAENNPSEEGLGNRSRQLNDAAVAEAIARYKATGQTQMDHSQKTNAVLDNGEGIVGSQYLHGSNSDAGGFQYTSRTTVTPNGDGTFTVQVSPEYTFNDRIDPNGKYATDRVKSTIAEIITFGKADPYDIHITWGDPVTMVVDANGNPVSRQGWPY